MANTRLIFFDVVVDNGLTQLKPKENLLTQAMISELTIVKGLQVIDQSSRDSLLAQKKLADCKKDDCRFEVAKALALDLMLVAKIEGFGDQCTVNMQIKAIETGAVKSSQFEAVSCEPIAILNSIKSTTSKIWPPK